MNSIVQIPINLKEFLKTFKYQNYHRHTSYSNTSTPDSGAMNEDYAKRAVELNHNILSSCEHGFQGNYWETYDLSKQYNLKFIFCAEAYWVKNRLEKDRTNSHIILCAKTETGRKAINRILSEANIDGYYYKPRVDLELLLSLPPKDVFVTSACVAFWKYENIDEIVLKLRNHFKENFMLEVQYHDTKMQKDLNKKILKLSKKYNIKIIMGCDSHYINPKQEYDRNYILEYKHIHYDNEDNWFMDYPTTIEAFKRFKKQGVLSNLEILNAMNNTNICLEFDNFDNLDIFNKDLIKLPSLFPDKTQKEKNQLYRQILVKEWKKYKEENKMTNEQLKEHVQGIKEEAKVVTDTKMTDYFIFDYYLIKDALEHGGIITNSGRGSAVSFFTNTLLGFSKVDRFFAPVKLYPERFMSKTRILKTKSLPDIDMNIGNPEVFAESQERLLGKGHSYPMIAWGTLKIKSAWKMYAGANGVDFDVSNKISEQLQDYENALKYVAEDEKDTVDVYEYVDKQYHQLLDESKKYRGIIMDKKKHACFDKDTLVLTDKGYEKIVNIKEGDMVLTHNNCFKEVLHIMNKKVDKIYELNITGEKLKVTGNHPMLVITNKYKKDGTRVGVSEPYWKEVEHLGKGDLVGISVNQKSIIPQDENLPTANFDFWWIIGRYLGDGYTSLSKKNGRNSNYTINISCHIKEVEEIESHIQNLFHYNIGNNTVSKNAKNIYFYNKKLYIFLQQFGKYAYGKKINNTILDLPTKLLESFLKGYLSADGHYSEFKDEQTFCTVSRELAYGIQHCIHKVFKKPCTIVLRKSSKGIINGKKFERKLSYNGRFKIRNNQKDRNYYKDGKIWIRYKNKDIKAYNGLVYNLEVKDNHSYTVNNFIVHNCGYLIYDKVIKEEIGLIKCKSETTKKEYLVALIDGKMADKYKFLKNDLLKVDVVKTNKMIADRIGIKEPNILELTKLVEDNPKVWDIFKNGYTLGVNQTESKGTTNKAKKFMQHNFSEHTAFIAGIRPSFKSMYPIFEKREPFEYGIPSFDRLIQTKEMKDSFILYQEQLMTTLGYSGIPMDETYGLIKAISKKKVAFIMSYKKIFLDGFANKLIQNEKLSLEKAQETSLKIWKIIEDSARYGFNASHAYCMCCDSLYGAYYKTFFPYEFYEVMLDVYSKKGKKDKVASFKQEMKKAFNINEGKMKFRLNNKQFTFDKKKNCIHPALVGIKGIGVKDSEELYLLKNNKYSNFIEVLKDIKEKTSVNQGKLKTLIKLDYFSEFGKSKYLLQITQLVNKLLSKKQIKKDKINELNDTLNINMTEELIKQYSQKETAKLFKEIDMNELINQLIKEIPNKDISLKDKLSAEIEYLGYPKTTIPNTSKDFYYVLELKIFKNKRSTTYYPVVYNIKTGEQKQMKLKDFIGFSENPFTEKNIIRVIEQHQERKRKKIDGKWTQSKTEFNELIDAWEVY